MRLLAWPIAILVLLAWTLAAYLMFLLSDWAAALVAGGLATVLSADIGPWSTWLLASLGNIIQGLVVVMWGLVALAILATPIWLRRRGRLSATWSPRAGEGYSLGDARSWRAGDWKRREVWRDRSRHDLDEIRDFAKRLVKDMRDKKFKKRKSWHDD